MKTIALLLIFALPVFAADPPGVALYKQQCLRCHGDAGQGTKKAPVALAGKLSVQQLAEVVQKTMPENDPGSLTAEQARQISEYIHGAFYSEIARDRIKPARIDLARLTVAQYRHAVADVLASFKPTPVIPDKHGLNGDYFNKTFQMDLRGTGVSQRIDANVDFDYGTDSPLPGKLEHFSYSVQWKGSVLAPETGEYEFTLRSEHAVKLFVNDLAKPLIDRWVKSGNDIEFSGRVYLVGGRHYPVRVDYSKGRQGRKDSEKGKPEAEAPKVKSSMRWSWTRPSGITEPVPSRVLIPVQVPEQYIVTAKFPPDDRSFGWERGTTVSKEWDAATTEAALDAAKYVEAKLNDLAGTKEGDPKRADKLKAFAVQFAETAFRRTLTTDQKAILIEKQFKDAKSPELAVKRVVLLSLKSPFFLYREVQGGTDQADTAARLAFILWDGLPDKLLRDAAAKGELKTPEQVRQQAERMLKDPRAVAKLKACLITWLKLDQPHDLAKDLKLYPGFDAAAIGDLRNSLEMFVDDVLASPTADYRQLLQAGDIYLNHRLAKLYGAEVKPEEGFKKVSLNADQRAGVLTHPYLMATFAYGKESSPIHRGVFLARGILGVSLRPPPEAVAPLAPDLHPKLTTRERVILQTNAAACATCHGVINPLGFTLEHFDAIGRYRGQDHDKPVDASGSYRTHAGQVVKVNGAKELGAFLAGSAEAHEAFAEQMFHHLVQQPVRAYGAKADDDLREKFVKHGFNMRKLAVEVAVTGALPARP